MIVVYLIAGIAALIWGILGLSRGSLMGWCLVFLVVGVCFGYSFLTFKLGPVPLSLDRIVLLLLAAAYVVQRRLGRTDPKPLELTDKLLLAFLGVLVLTRKSNQSIMIGDDIEVSVLAIMGEKVRIGIEAPRSVPVFRKEVYVEIQAGRDPAADRKKVDEALGQLSTPTDNST